MCIDRLGAQRIMIALNHLKAKVCLTFYIMNWSQLLLKRS